MNMCMVCDNDKVLVIDRKKQSWPGITSLGGHIEKDEAIVNSIIREVKEETNITIELPIPCGIVDWCNEKDREIVLLYKATSFSGSIQSSSEGDVWWERIDNLINLNLTPGFDTYLKVFEDENFSEIFYRRMEDDAWIEELK